MKIVLQSFKLFLVMTIITGIIYPLLITFIAQGFFTGKANGSLVRQNGEVIGSILMGQKFTSSRYFWSRPSAINYNPLPSGGSNLGPTSLVLKNSIMIRRETLEKFNPGSTFIPSDLLLSSASGLDPDISPEAARYQIDRIAQTRGLDNNARNKLINIIETHIEQPDFNIFGEPRVNVLRLNLALDSTFERHIP